VSEFPNAIDAYWHESFLTGDRLFSSETLTVTVNPDLAADRRLMLMESVDGKVMAVLTPELTDRMRLSQHHDLTVELLREELRDAQIKLHGADYVFHFRESDRQVVLQEPLPDGVRQLHAADETVFGEFESHASEQDLDDAYVELDHWAVFGAFEQDRLVCAASMYPWAGRMIADVGVLTLPPFRGNGHARRVIRAISGHALAQGYEPQYRCQLDNVASAALAKAAGLTVYGEWDVISSVTVDP